MSPAVLDASEQALHVPESIHHSETKLSWLAIVGAGHSYVELQKILSLCRSVKLRKILSISTLEEGQTEHALRGNMSYRQL
jgi:hypothetical protein